jgi:hypothetical protein
MLNSGNIQATCRQAVQPKQHQHKAAACPQQHSSMIGFLRAVSSCFVCCSAGAWCQPSILALEQWQQDALCKRITMAMSKGGPQHSSLAQWHTHALAHDSYSHSSTTHRTGQYPLKASNAVSAPCCPCVHPLGCCTYPWHLPVCLLAHCHGDTTTCCLVPAAASSLVVLQQVEAMLRGA